MESPAQLGFHGWLWHSLSILYELGCLQRASYYYANRCYSCVHRCSSSDLACLKNCKSICDNSSKYIGRSLQHVWDWNWKTFVRVEEKLFFPWLRSYHAKYLYENILQDLERERNHLIQFSNKQQSHLWKPPSPHSLAVWRKKFVTILGTLTFLWNDWSWWKRRQPLSSTFSRIDPCRQLKMESEYQYQQQFKIYRFITKLRDMCNKYFVHERKWLLPKITSAQIPVAEQKKFNNRVLRFLGYSNCRLQLVVLDESLKHMSKEDWRQFRSQVPPPIRLLIPYWKRRYYKPLHRRMCVMGL